MPLETQNRYALVKDGATINVILWDGDEIFRAAMERQGFTVTPESEAPPMIASDAQGD